eukprot:CAMPEP_0119329642 /NCGR_PEP_ID=MMETSP1333-20130426/76335_1 /TAXON_ID=418940 /ORGANISM="Scyphosphaera apsteinii, Strain RCC1455" /LENGTH=393 /DNA_ID=CAMNT_0007338809 /DNA_START=8 /DNA_END=1189 /DNA_ORIENTATION=+
MRLLHKASGSIIILASVLPAADGFAVVSVFGRQFDMLNSVILPVRRSLMLGSVKEIDSENFSNVLSSTPNLAVVEFFAPWCRVCTAVAPQYERLAFKLSDKATFFKVNFKQNKGLSLRERVFQLPVVHFYVAGVGRVNRFSLTATTAGSRLLNEVSRFVDAGEGESSRIDLLRTLNSAALGPLVRYNALIQSLQGLARADELLSSEDDVKTQGLQQVFLTDERRLAHLEEIFVWLDEDGSGTLDADELEKAITAIGKQDDSELDPASLIERIVIASGGREAVSIDLDVFVRIMTCKAVQEFGSPQKELLPIFKAIDVDGSGTISKDEMLGALENLFEALPDPAYKQVVSSVSLPAAFDAFDYDSSGEMDYEEFVTMITSNFTTAVEADKDLAV